MKRDIDEMEEETPMKRARHAGDTEVRLLIQSKAAGSVIGKGGQNISRLRSENQASVTVPDCPGPERILTIGGTEETVFKVLAEIADCLNEAMGSSEDCDLRLLVHQSQAGCVIGKGGSKIKELREECHGQIKVYTNCCPQSTDRIVQINAEKSAAVKVICKIIDLVKLSPVKGLSNPYNPHNFDEYFSHEYGGWGDGPKGRGGPPMGRLPPHMGGPMGRGGLMGPSPIGGPLGPPGPPPFGRRGPGSMPRGPPIGQMRGGNGGGMNGDYDDMRAVDRRGGGGRDHYMNGAGPHDDDDIKTNQVTIPKDVAGAIIGKGGARIRKIRSDSGCSITIEDAKPGSNDRIISILGTDHQIKHAEYLLQQSVREFGGPPSRRY